MAVSSASASPWALNHDDDVTPYPCTSFPGSGQGALFLLSSPRECIPVEAPLTLKQNVGLIKRHSPGRKGETGIFTASTDVLSRPRMLRIHYQSARHFLFPHYFKEISPQKSFLTPYWNPGKVPAIIGAWLEIMRRPTPSEDPFSLFRLLGLGLELGLGLALPTVCGVIVGRWLDGRFGTSAVFTLGLLVGGLSYGGYGFYRTVVRELSKWK